MKNVVFESAKLIYYIFVGHVVTGACKTINGKWLSLETEKLNSIPVGNFIILIPVRGEFSNSIGILVGAMGKVIFLVINYLSSLHMSHFNCIYTREK